MKPHNIGLAVRDVPAMSDFVSTGLGLTAREGEDSLIVETGWPYLFAFPAAHDSSPATRTPDAGLAARSPGHDHIS